MQRAANRLKPLGKLAQNTRDLLSLALRQLHELVVGLDGFKRLHENRLARGARAVYHAMNAATVFRANWNHEALIAQCDVVFARFGIARAQNLFERPLDGFSRLRDAGANPL